VYLSAIFVISNGGDICYWKGGCKAEWDGRGRRSLCVHDVEKIETLGRFIVDRGSPLYRGVRVCNLQLKMSHADLISDVVRGMPDIEVGLVSSFAGM
jgi:hypothetical protein